MNDYIIRAIAANDQIRAFAAVTTETVETARQDHNYKPGSHSSTGTSSYSRCYDGYHDEGG